MKVYSMNVLSIDGEDKKWYKYLSEKRIEKVERLKKPHKKSQSVGAELLLGYVLGQEKGTVPPVKWDTDENGKLYLTDYDDVYVNLSHSSDYAVCAIHDKPIGVDIQYKKECDIRMAKRFFAPDEFEFVNSSQDREDAFFEIWTKKESFVKAIGKGITVPLNSFSVLGNQTRYCGAEYLFKEYKVKNDGYKLFVCYLK